MGFMKKEFFINEQIMAFKFLMNEFKCSMKIAQKWIDKKRVFEDGKVVVEKNKTIFGKIEVIFFEPRFSGNYPIFETEDFAVFEKPSGVMVHPNGFFDTYSLNDDIKYLFGKDANPAHRIDKETSGIILIAKNKKSEAELKKMFEKREVKKEYIALVRGEMSQRMVVDASLKSNLEFSKIRIKSFVVDSGLKAITQIFPLYYMKNLDATLVKAVPITGRTHQIRAHLFHVKHQIIGDPIYGLDESIVEEYLAGKLSEENRVLLTSKSRLMLHANSLSFKYKNIDYNIKSKIKLGDFDYE